MAALGPVPMPLQLAALLLMPQIGQCGLVPIGLVAKMFRAVWDGLETDMHGADPGPASQGCAGHHRWNRA